MGRDCSSSSCGRNEAGDNTWAPASERGRDLACFLGVHVDMSIFMEHILVLHIPYPPVLVFFKLVQVLGMHIRSSCTLPDLPQRLSECGTEYY